MTTTHLPALVVPEFDSFAVRQVMAAFLAGYGDTTREAYSLDLRQWLRWCACPRRNRCRHRPLVW